MTGEETGTLAPGFGDPVGDAQGVFRAVLTAMSRPGRIVDLPAGTTPPAPLNPAAAAILLTLVDMDTPLWLDPAADRPEVRAWLRFHCGCPLRERPDEAAFALIADPAGMPPLEAFAAGDPDYPDRSASLIVQVARLEAETGFVLRGPGIETQTRLDIAPVPANFAATLAANHALYPCGVDLMLAGSDRLAALPRSVSVGED